MNFLKRQGMPDARKLRALDVKRSRFVVVVYEALTHFLQRMTNIGVLDFYMRGHAVIVRNFKCMSNFKFSVYLCYLFFLE